jgi:NAD-dependent dihydropyrimidine dehydrogenase PreA subunit
MFDPLQLPSLPREVTPMSDAKPYMEVDFELCKGCQLCLDVCPKSVIAISDKLNSSSYHPAYYTGDGCTGCGLCFYACPEPGAIRVVKP